MLNFPWIEVLSRLIARRFRCGRYLKIAAPPNKKKEKSTRRNWVWFSFFFLSLLPRLNCTLMPSHPSRTGFYVYLGFLFSQDGPVSSRGQTKLFHRPSGVVTNPFWNQTPNSERHPPPPSFSSSTLIYFNCMHFNISSCRFFTSVQKARALCRQSYSFYT